MRKESHFEEGFTDYKTKYCLPKLSEPILPSKGKANPKTTKRRREKNNEEAYRKVKKPKNGVLGRL